MYKNKIPSQQMFSFVYIFPLFAVLWSFLLLQILRNVSQSLSVNFYLGFIHTIFISITCPYSTWSSSITWSHCITFLCKKDGYYFEYNFVCSPLEAVCLHCLWKQYEYMYTYPYLRRELCILYFLYKYVIWNSKCGCEIF